MDGDFEASLSRHSLAAPPGALDRSLTAAAVRAYAASRRGETRYRRAWLAVAAAVIAAVALNVASGALEVPRGVPQMQAHAAPSIFDAPNAEAIMARLGPAGPPFRPEDLGPMARLFSPKNGGT